MVHQTSYLFTRSIGCTSNTGALNGIGTLLVVGGVGYFLVDQFNTIVVQGEEATWNENVGTASVAMVAVGLPMMLIKKKSQRLKPGYRLLTVEEGSPFYLPELQHMQF